MFLKRIDVTGFKSFADKTNLDFSPGITAVVGPNGSGKSNIADAIRWVLGEQSAKSLRGTKMEDVIFVGSETRKAVNYCEVSLTLDNTDHHLPVVFDEVTITRRVYRSGEGEYFLNKQACRLKDIHELFMDSGLGRESYSIIGQGKIEEMLSSRAEDRRGPFEDAAGIVKFKHRRKEAERKLDETAANLIRVDDILAEFERQAGPLREEAERASQFKVLDDELQGLDVRVLVVDIESLQAKWRTAAEDVQVLTEKRVNLAQELSVLEQRLGIARLQFEEQNNKSEVLQRRLVDGVEERQRTEGNLALLKERLVNTERNLADKASQHSVVEAEIHDLSVQVESERTKLNQVFANIELKQSHLEVAAQKVDPAVRSEIQSDISRLNADLIEAHQASASLRNEIKMAEDSRSTEDRRLERFTSEIEKWESESRALQAQIEQLESVVAEHRHELEQLQFELIGRNEQMRDTAAAEARVQGAIHQLESKRASLKSRIELLRDLEEGYDGFALGVKTVLQAADKSRLQGVHGAVASLIRVPKRVETAVEIALGGTLQNIVVGTEADARAAITMLKNRQAGRATFMPMSVIKSRRLAAGDVAKVRTMPGYIGVASEEVDYDETYRQVVEHLLGNVILADSLVNANAIARALDYRIRIVTLEGDVVSPGGTMAGGSSVRKGPGLLGRSRERNDIEEQLKNLEEELAQLQRNQSDHRALISQIQADGQQIGEKIEALRNKISECNVQKREYESRNQSASERLAGVKWELEQLQTGQATRNSMEALAKSKLDEVLAAIANLEDEISKRRGDLEHWDNAAQNAQDSLTALKVEVATLAQEKSSIEHRVQDTLGRMARLRERTDQLNVDRIEFETVMGQTTRAIAENEERFQVLSDAVTNLETELAHVRLFRQEAELSVVDAEKAVRVQQQAVGTVDEQLHRAEVQAERFDIELNHALARMGETYQMTYEWAKEHFPIEDTVENMKRQAESLRRKIAQLGEVRVGAIDEWQRLNERMEFYTRERSDLDLAKSNLLDVIHDIDDEMSRRFTQAFEQIRAEFQIAFRQLFGGGRADLELTDPANVLHSGIDVTAQPPGKKLQNLNLMSGGERALTAMAMLFAILKVRPVPFCVLDEVEAALDEANVSRFAQQLRRFSDETQFIVITHRRGTMEEADALYGVTMQESGVSSMISVRLSDEVDFETA